MGKDYGQYHDDVWDLTEMMQGTADVRIKYLADEKIADYLKKAIEYIDMAKSLLIKKSEVLPTI